MVLISRSCSPTAEKLRRLEADQLLVSYLLKGTLVFFAFTSLEDAQGVVESLQTSTLLQSTLIFLTIFLPIVDGLIKGAVSP